MALSWLLSSIRSIVDTFLSVYEFLYPNQLKRLPPIRDTLLLKSASEITRLIRSRKVSCVQVVTVAINRIKECEPLVNALVDERFAEALEEAKSIDDALDSGQKIEGVLLGVPFTGKETHAVKGLSWTAGLLSKRGRKATQDAPVMCHLRNAGAICLGVTNVPEFCYWWDSCNKLYGATKNPYDLTRIPGGSTGGNACLVSYGGCSFGNASDIGGSIRMPAGFCGVYGHKPTPGIVSTDGHFPPMGDYGDQLFVIGPICRYVQDIRPVLTAMAGGEDVINSKLPRFKDTVNWSKMKIYYQLDGGDPACTRTKPYIKKAIHRAARHFADKYNATVEEVNVEEFSEACNMFIEYYAGPDTPQFSSAICDGQGEMHIWKELALSLIGRSQFTFPCIVVSIIEKYKSTSQAAESVEKLRQFTRKFHSMLGQDAIFLFPLHPEVAPKHKTTLLKLNNALAYCCVFNFMKTPVTVCPLGLNDEGLPMSVQIIASPSMDHLTIEAATELNSLFGGWTSPCTIDVDTTD